MAGIGNAPCVVKPEVGRMSGEISALDLRRENDTIGKMSHPRALAGKMTIAFLGFVLGIAVGFSVFRSTDNRSSLSANIEFPLPCYVACLSAYGSDRCPELAVNCIAECAKGDCLPVGSQGCGTGPGRQCCKTEKCLAYNTAGDTICRATIPERCLSSSSQSSSASSRESSSSVKSCPTCETYLTKDQTARAWCQTDGRDCRNIRNTGSVCFECIDRSSSQSSSKKLCERGEDCPPILGRRRFCCVGGLSNGQCMFDEKMCIDNHGDVSQ